MGQQLGQRLPSGSLRGADALLAEQQPEVPLQPALDGVAQGQIEDVSRGGPGRYAAVQRPVFPRVRGRRGLRGREQEDKEEGKAH